MQPCDELKNIALKHYGKFYAGEQAHSIEDTYSRQEGVVIISNDPNEWFDDRSSIETFIKTGGSFRLDIEVQNLVAYCEGSVGWTTERVTVMLPSGVAIPVRYTRIFHQEEGAWKMSTCTFPLRFPMKVSEYESSAPSEVKVDGTSR